LAARSSRILACGTPTAAKTMRSKKKPFVIILKKTVLNGSNFIADPLRISLLFYASPDCSETIPLDHLLFVSLSPFGKKG
jgi:hypothetical protein